MLTRLASTDASSANKCDRALFGIEGEVYINTLKRCCAGRKRINFKSDKKAQLERCNFYGEYFEQLSPGRQDRYHYELNSKRK